MFVGGRVLGALKLSVDVDNQGTLAPAGVDIQRGVMRLEDGQRQPGDERQAGKCGDKRAAACKHWSA